MPYLAKACRPDFNNDLGGDSNSGPILAPGVYLSTTRIMVPPKAISIWCQMELHLLMFSWWVPYLAKGCRPDFNNSLVGDLNSGPILAPGIFKSDSNNGPSPGHLNLVSEGVTFVHVSYLWFSGRCHIWPRATSIMASEVTRIMASFLLSGVYLSLTRIMAPPQAIPMLNCKHELAQKLF